MGFCAAFVGGRRLSQTIIPPTCEMRRFACGLVVLGLLVAQEGWAKGTDLNGDGVFSKDELLQARQKQLDKKFVKIDTNQDGQISMDELQGQRGGIAKKADANKDGVITKAEAQAYMNQTLDKYMQKKDVNADGKLDQNERKRQPKSATQQSNSKSQKKLNGTNSN